MKEGVISINRKPKLIIDYLFNAEEEIGAIT
jgi:hypothetical protein